MHLRNRVVRGCAQIPDNFMCFLVCAAVLVFHICSSHACHLHRLSFLGSASYHCCQATCHLLDLVSVHIVLTPASMLSSFDFRFCSAVWHSSQPSAQSLIISSCFLPLLCCQPLYCALIFPLRLLHASLSLSLSISLFILSRSLSLFIGFCQLFVFRLFGFSCPCSPCLSPHPCLASVVGVLSLILPDCAGVGQPHAAAPDSRAVLP